MSYKFSKNSRNIVNSTRVVLANRKTGQWIRMSKETYDILNLGINNNLSIDELKANLYDAEDKEYINELYKKLYKIGVIETLERGSEIVLQNKMVGFEITHKCNLKCTHCCMNADEIHGDKKDLTTDEVKSMFNKAIAWNPKYIMLSGGEPLIRKDFIELLTYLKKNYNGNIILSTNGTLINKENANILAKCCYQIDISLDGVDEETCSKVRGSGIFDKVVENTKLLKSTGFENITLSMVVGNRNEYLVYKFIELNNHLDTKAVIRKFSSIGRGIENKEKFLYNHEKEFYISKEFLNSNYKRAFGVSNCNAGKNEMIISYNGEIFPCPSFMEPKYLLGNLLEVDSIEYLINSTNNIDLLEKEILNKYKQCKDCKVNLFCWTCPGCLAEIDNQDVFEDRCKKLKPVLYKRVWGK